MENINDVIEMVESRMKGVTVDAYISHSDIWRTLNQELKGIGIKIQFTKDGNGSPILDINSKDFPQTRMRQNETTYKVGIRVQLRRKITYTETMFSKKANGYIWNSIDRLKSDIEINGFLHHCKQVNLKLQKFIKSKKAAKAQCSKLGLGWDFERLGVYTLQRILNLTEKGKKDVLIDILETLNSNFTMDTILK